MKFKSLLAAVAATGISLVFLAAACGGGDHPATVEVSLAEFSILTAVNEIKAGEVTFVVANNGEEPHEFVIIKSDFPAGQLPVVEAKVPEDAVNVIDEIEPFAAGTTERLTLNLTAGKYIFICNIVKFPPDQPLESHYQEGMRVTFLVTE